MIPVTCKEVVKIYSILSRWTVPIHRSITIFLGTPIQNRASLSQGTLKPWHILCDEGADLLWKGGKKSPAVPAVGKILGAKSWTLWVNTLCRWWLHRTCSETMTFCLVLVTIWVCNLQRWLHADQNWTGCRDDQWESGCEPKNMPIPPKQQRSARSLRENPTTPMAFPWRQTHLP